MRSILIFISAVISWVPLHAQIALRSIDDVWDFADKNNVELKEANDKSAMAQLNVSHAVGAFLPSANIVGGLTDNVTIQPTLVPAELFGGAPGTYLEQKFGKRYNYNIGINAQVDIINTSNWFLLKSARLQKEMSQTSIEQVRTEVYTRAADLYFSYVLTAQLTDVFSRSVDALAKTLRHAENKLMEGQISATQLNAITINLEKSRLQLISARAEGLSIYNSFKALLGIHHDDTVLLASDSIALGEVAADSIIFATSPGVKLAQFESLVARSELRHARSTFVPILSLVYSVGTQLAGDQFLDLGNSNSLPQQYWGLRLSIPLFTHYDRMYLLQKNTIESRLRERQLESTTNQQALTDQTILSNYKSAKTAATKAAEILRLYLDNDRHAANKLSLGMISVDERLRIHQDYLDYFAEYLNYMSQYFICSYKMELRLKSNQ